MSNDKKASDVNSVSREDWLIERKKLLLQEKKLTQLRDAVSKQRRDLPWLKVDKEYFFAGEAGQKSLADLFDGRSQLIVYHFMYAPDWEEGCPSCSFWADNYDGISVHLNHRDISLAVVSRAPLDSLLAYRKRMGWHFQWVSSLENDFNYDYHVSFTPEEMANDGVYYNYAVRRFPSPEAPGVSVFVKDPQGNLFHTYSCYSRGLDVLNGAYHHMDLVPRGRNEGDLPHTMAWLRRHDAYDN